MVKSIYKIQKAMKLVVDMELTDFCNAKCPLCGRSSLIHVGGEIIDVERSQGASVINRKHVTITEFELWFSDLLMSGSIMGFCFFGNFGDPGVCPDLMRICNYIKENSPETYVKISTNGGMRNPEFWAELGRTLYFNTSNEVTFWVDSLTDNKYRIGVEPLRTLNNLQGFCSTNKRNVSVGILIFEHNFREIEEITEIVRGYGVNKVFKKKVHGMNRGYIEYLYKHKREKLYRTSNTLDYYRKPGKFNKREDLKYVDCIAKKELRVYVDSHGYVAPCCWLSAKLRSMYPTWYAGDKDSDDVIIAWQQKKKDVQKSLGLRNIIDSDVRSLRLNEENAFSFVIEHHNLFCSGLIEYWNLDSSFCQEVCGVYKNEQDEGFFTKQRGKREYL